MWTPTGSFVWPRIYHFGKTRENAVDEIYLFHLNENHTSNNQMFKYYICDQKCQEMYHINSEIKERKTLQRKLTEELELQFQII